FDGNLCPMPIEMYCDHCGLIFSAGMYGVRGRHPFRNLIVCRSCGTCHELRLPASAGTPVRFLALPGPLILQDRPGRPVFTSKRLDWQDIALQVDETTTAAEVNDWLAGVSCSHCGATDTLSMGWDSTNLNCPSCGKASLVYAAGWIT